MAGQAAGPGFDPCQKLNKLSWYLFDHIASNCINNVQLGPLHTQAKSRDHGRVREAFELNQLKSAPSQLLPVFSGFDRLQTCCHSFGLTNILFFFFKCRLISSSL
jgi:hypothetical protein